jgi:hypothetical protein
MVHRSRASLIWKPPACDTCRNATSPSRSTALTLLPRHVNAPHRSRVFCLDRRRGRASAPCPVRRLLCRLDATNPIPSKCRLRRNHARRWRRCVPRIQAKGGLYRRPELAAAARRAAPWLVRTSQPRRSRSWPPTAARPGIAETRGDRDLTADADEDRRSRGTAAFSESRNAPPSLPSC